MISVEEALQLVRENVQPLPAASVACSEALGLKLVEPIVSSSDSPPFDKSMLDGYAVVASDSGPTRRVIEQVLAGDMPQQTVVPGTASNVMTGAPMPAGADAIIKVEDIELLHATSIKVPQEGVPAGYGVLKRGTIYHAGDELLPAGQKLSPVDLALLAELGRATVQTIPRPRVAVLATGNELVPAGEALGPGQICNSNGPLLMALLQRQHATPRDYGIGGDDPQQLKFLMTQALEVDVLLVTGGVSAGVKDLVPGLLQELGVQQVFHKLNMKPGKPLWFGVFEQGERRKLVFGLPGNPVSTLVGFELLVKPALRVLRGEEFQSPQTQAALLTTEAKHRGPRPTYHPCKIDFGQREEGKPVVATLNWLGSADLATLSRANAFVLLPAGDYTLPPGSEVEVLPL